MKLIGSSGKHVKKSAGAKLAEAVQQRVKEQVNTAVDNQVAKMQSKSAARSAEKTAPTEKQAASYKAPDYKKPEEPKKTYAQGRHGAPPKKTEPKREAEPRKTYTQGRHEVPPKRPEQKKAAEHKDEPSWDSFVPKARKAEYKFEPEEEYEWQAKAAYAEEGYAEPESVRQEYTDYGRTAETAVDAADRFDDYDDEDFYYDEWMPVGAKSKLKKKQELLVRQREELEKNRDIEDEWGSGRRKKKSKGAGKKKHGPARAVIVIACLLVIFVDMYFRFLYTDLPFIRDLRDAYIETAMSTMSHQWMAEWFFPQDIIDEVTSRVEKAQQDQQGIESDWNKKPEPEDEEEEDVIETEADFYELFWEIDKNTFKDYAAEHPEVLENGWGEVYINEAGLDDSGTSIWTKMDEQVLAIDVPNRIILIRVKGSGYQGVLAVAKDPSRLSLCPAQNVGSTGEQLESIMRRTDAVLGMTGSGFIDEGGNGNGGEIVGFARCGGEDYGTQVGYPYKRTELRQDNLLYVVDSGNDVSKNATDAVEFAPALVINGEALIDDLSGYTSINPRACIGQTEKGELLMLVIEGRLPSRSFGVGLPECTEILMKHNAYQAMNLDGGTSAIMWYDGEYVTKCSNTAITCRTLPNAWIYARESLD